MKIYVINGPSINMLGIREPEHYGNTTYEGLCNKIKTFASNAGVEVVFYQSNHEGNLIDKIHEAYFEKADGIVINPGGYTHTSVSILDALKAVKIPTVEVHISKLEERERFRHVSFISHAAVHRIVGHGIDGYTEAIEFLIKDKK